MGNWSQSFLLGVAFFAGAGLATPPRLIAAPLTVVDDTGRSVILRGPPKRLLSLTPSSTEIVFALGAEDRIVAVDQWSDYPPAAKAKPRIPPPQPKPGADRQAQPGSDPLDPWRRRAASGA